MSNKDIRRPANPEYEKPAQRSDSPAPAVGDSPAPAPAAGEGQGDSAGQAERRGQSPEAGTVPAGDGRPAEDVFDPPFGNGQDWPDMRFPIRRVGLQNMSALSDDDVRRMLAVVDRFCIQVIEITAAVLDTVPVGEVRQIVAAEIAPSGAMITQDGKLREATIKMPPAAEPARRPRGASHPLIALIKLAMQACKVVLRSVSGSHPEIARKRTIKPEKEKTYEQIYREMGQFLRVT